jgi:hypothetical protein
MGNFLVFNLISSRKKFMWKHRIATIFNMDSGSADLLDLLTRLRLNRFIQNRYGDIHPA